MISRYCQLKPDGADWTGDARSVIPTKMNWIVYILECSDNTLYTGITTDIKRRMAEHENGTGAKYTKGRGPFKVVYSELQPTMSHALKREAEIKSLNRSAKQKLASWSLSDFHSFWLSSGSDKCLEV